MFFINGVHPGGGEDALASSLDPKGHTHPESNISHEYPPKIYLSLYYATSGLVFKNFGFNPFTKNGRYHL